MCFLLFEVNSSIRKQRKDDSLPIYLDADGEWKRRTSSEEG